jgi:hypothetical protein
MTPLDFWAGLLALNFHVRNKCHSKKFLKLLEAI